MKTILIKMYTYLKFLLSDCVSTGFIYLLDSYAGNSNKKHKIIYRTLNSQGTSLDFNAALG